MRFLRPAGLILLVVVLAAAAAVGGFAGSDRIRTAREKPQVPVTTPALPPVYGAAAAAPPAPPPTTAAPVPVPAAVARALAPARAAPGLGREVRAEVIDVATGGVLYDRGSTAVGAPASTAKLLTAAALLTVRAPTDRITTSVVSGSGGAIVLVGGGDPTLTGAAKGQPGAYPGAARITDLAAQLQRAHVTPTRIVVDDALFTGPATSPGWDADDVPSTYASAITAVMTDGGRATPAAAIRSATPELAAGRELAAALGRPALPVAVGPAPATTAAPLATVRSAPFSTLIEQMLQESDNVIAECLARQVALATHRPASFTGSAAAIRSVLTTIGIDPGAGMVDGSGLAAGDRLSPRTLTAVLRSVSATGPSALRTVVAGLPVAAWSGTLAHRFEAPAARAARGVVRGKTGTLTGVSSLAGLVHDRSGRLLAFAFIADRVGSAPAAETALDALVAPLAACGCG